VVGMEEKAVNGRAAVPTVASWWNARSSAFLMIVNWSEFNKLSYSKIHDVNLVVCSHDLDRTYIRSPEKMCHLLKQDVIEYGRNGTYKRIGLFKKHHAAKWVLSSWIVKSPFPANSLKARVIEVVRFF
jgi:hypothetical protein